MKQLAQGEVYLFQLSPSKKNEIGKLRPCVILTSSRILRLSTVNLFICPLSGQSTPAFQSLHVKLLARDQLKQTSYAIVEQARAVSGHRLVGDRIASLKCAELKKITERLIDMVSLAS